MLYERRGGARSLGARSLKDISEIPHGREFLACPERSERAHAFSKADQERPMLIGNVIATER